MQRLPAHAWNGFARGTKITLTFRDTLFKTHSAYLFASVLSHYLALHASINSFTQLVVSTRQGEGVLKSWPPRAGELQLV